MSFFASIGGSTVFIKGGNKSILVMTESPAVFLRKWFDLPIALYPTFRPDSTQFRLVHRAQPLSFHVARNLSCESVHVLGGGQRLFV